MVICVYSWLFSRGSHSPPPPMQARGRCRGGVSLRPPHRFGRGISYPPYTLLQILGVSGDWAKAEWLRAEVRGSVILF